jgi:hypothetical protein
MLLLLPLQLTPLLLCLLLLLLLLLADHCGWQA